MPQANDETPESNERMFDSYRELQKEIVQAKDAASPDLPELYLKRGTWRIRMGAAKGGLIDLLRAYVTTSESAEPVSREVIEAAQSRDVDALLKEAKIQQAVFEKPRKAVGARLYAQLGEAFRIYVRDVLLSLPSDQGKLQQSRRELATFAGYSIGAFNASLSKVDEDTKPSGEQKAWLLAHRGATYTMLYWLARVTTTQEAKADAQTLFERADKSFTLALEEKQEYVWAQLFKAFLLALRGEVRTSEDPSDFRRARNLLRSLEPNAKSSGVNQSFISRHKAMLYSYDVGEDLSRDNAGDSLEAAKRSLESSWVSQRQDDLDFLGPYFGTLSAYYLYTKNSQDYPCDLESLETAIESAAMRSRNALSQALVALAGLHRLTEEIYKGSKDEAENAKAAAAFAERERLEKIFSWFPPDLETLAIFLRKPLDTILKQPAYEKIFFDVFSLKENVLGPELMNSLLNFKAPNFGKTK